MDWLIVLVREWSGYEQGRGEGGGESSAQAIHKSWSGFRIWFWDSINLLLTSQAISVEENKPIYKKKSSI